MISNSSEPSMQRTEQIKNVFRGMILLGKGRAEGINLFINSSESLLNALAPWIAFSFVTNILIPLSSYNVQTSKTLLLNLGFFLVNLCDVIVSIVIVQWYANFWQKGNVWKRAGTAMLWCSWLPIIDFLFFVMLATILFLSSLKILTAFMLIIAISCIVYTIWLMWFSIMHGLQIRKKQSVLVVLSIISTKVVMNLLFIMLNYNVMIQYLNMFKQTGMIMH
ncbi:hypothetical protein COMNV_01171 [Commensalibacter sp. Nvir]|uniref:hypothetical protein n=1 Tax=Commensalibacter sp. Nvir TaxID=3069817 RepID=UPI002D6A72FF|nr:hypothetical protein COMNV_01171 [Commensalibacter sp. Nvir]